MTYSLYYATINKRIQVLDRWGNTSVSGVFPCRKEEAARLRLEIERDWKSGHFSDEEKWEILLRELPAPGETRPLEISRSVRGLDFQVFMVGGPGAYQFQGSELKSAAPLFLEVGTKESEMSAARKLGPDVGGNWFTQRPFVAMRVQRVDAAVAWALEGNEYHERQLHDTLWTYSRNSKTKSFVCVPFEEPNPVIIVQKPLRAEFVIRLPRVKGRQSDSEEKAP